MVLTILPFLFEAKITILNNYYVLAETVKQMYDIFCILNAIFLIACKLLIADKKKGEKIDLLEIFKQNLKSSKRIINV